MIERIHHVAYVVDDMDDALARFTDVFGVEPVYRAERHDEFELETALYDAGEGLIEFISPISRRGWAYDAFLEAGEGFFHVGYEVADLDRAIERLQRRGVDLVTESPQTGVGGAWKLITIADHETVVPTQLVEDTRDDRSTF